MGTTERGLSLNRSRREFSQRVWAGLEGLLEGGPHAGAHVAVDAVQAWYLVPHALCLQDLGGAVFVHPRLETVRRQASRDPSALGIDVWNRKLLARYLLGVDDAKAGEVMAACTAVFPGCGAIGVLYLIEFEYLRQPVAPLLARDDFTSWNERLESA